jgi:hypothetical protein
MSMQVDTLPEIPAGPVADRIAVWPLDSGQYGLDATFQGASGYSRMEAHEEVLRQAGVRFSLVQELGGGWTLRFGPLTAAEISRAMAAFVV